MMLRFIAFCAINQKICYNIYRSNGHFWIICIIDVTSAEHIMWIFFPSYIINHRGMAYDSTDTMAQLQKRYKDVVQILLLFLP